MKAFAIAVLSVLGLAFLVAPASASTGCDAGEMCLWSGTHYGGSPVVLSLADTNPGSACCSTRKGGRSSTG
ncbi:peptidase inhibitor family I36 protein [Actinokineospora soli]|uniref:Peptidase inhibitor family I36 protein n=1 Tax=Actinokineospora soli TaxID=1048753 RepID=A0ABW2TJD8_9PSEU